MQGRVTILNADNYFNLHILNALGKSPADTAAAVDFTRPLASDAMKTRVDGSRVTFLSKTLPDEFTSARSTLKCYHFTEVRRFYLNIRTSNSNGSGS